MMFQTPRLSQLFLSRRCLWHCSSRDVGYPWSHSLMVQLPLLNLYLMFEARLSTWRHKPANPFTAALSRELSVRHHRSGTAGDQNEMVASKFSVVPQLTQTESQSFHTTKLPIFLPGLDLCCRLPVLCKALSLLKI